MDSRGFEELSQHFTEKLSSLAEALSIESCMESKDEDVQEESGQSMQSLWQEVDDLSAILTLVRSKCADQCTTLKGVEDVKRKLQTLVKGLQYTQSNIPAYLPAVSAPASSNQSPDTAGETRVSASSSSMRCHEAGPRGDGRESLQSQTTNKNSVTTGNKKPPCPLVEYLTVDEFDDIPKYMKGRLAYQQVNTVVDELNKAFTAKYKLMRQKRTTMSDVHRKRFETLKMQETKDTKGVYFLVEADIKDWSSLKMSKETRTFFTLLRHCGRIYEIRGGGHVRYAMTDMY